MIMSKASLFLFCFLSIVLHVQSSATLDFNVNTTTNSSSSSSLPFNITIGSSISASSSNQTTSYWLSPSGLFAFGFYPLCYDCGQYKVAIWINKLSNKVVVWSLEGDNSKELIYDGASILLNHDGVFMIGVKNSSATKPLFDSVSGPASYASMEDTGNFVVYNSDLNVIWQSFSYHSDTILQGQTLKSGESLHPNTGYKYQLIMQKYGNLELLEDDENSHDYYHMWESKTYKEGGDIVLKLDSTGLMYLVDKNGIVIKNLTKGENERSIDTIYRATLESDGYLRLYGEKIRSDESGKLTVYCVTCKRPHRIHIFGWSYTATVVAITLLVVAVVIFLICWCCCRDPSHQLQKELDNCPYP